LICSFPELKACKKIEKFPQLPRHFQKCLEFPQMPRQYWDSLNCLGISGIAKAFPEMPDSRNSLQHIQIRSFDLKILSFIFD
jgi:hypothetical protein